MTVPEGFYVGVGSAIKTARTTAKVTQAQLATAVGLQRTSISNIEKGRQKFLLDTFYRISFALHIAPTALLEDGLNAMKAMGNHADVKISFHGLSEEEEEIITKSLKINEGGSSDA